MVGIWRNGCAAALALAASALAAQPPAPSPLPPGDADLRARYAIAGARFAMIDGAPIDYVDQGHGPAIVLIHGSYASLREWKGWARTLSRHYRVIRFDAPPAGLSGPEPDGVYGATREQAVMDALTRRLGVDRFLLVATSSGGAVAIAFAAQHPDRLTGLVLNNIGLTLGGRAAPLPAAFRAAIAADAGRKGMHGEEFWRQVLRFNFADPAKVTPALVREWTELNNRAPAFAQAPGQPSPGEAILRSEDDLRHITVPTLLLWSADDRDTPLDPIGRRALAALAAPDKALVVVPRCGHMLPLECGARGLAAAMPFVARIAGPFDRSHR